MRIPQEVRDRERRDIRLFTMDCLIYKEGARTFSVEIYAAYRDWRMNHGMEDTELSIDSFGRQFPKQYKRQLMFRDGTFLNGIKDMAIKHD